MVAHRSQSKNQYSNLKSNKKIFDFLKMDVKYFFFKKIKI